MLFTSNRIKYLHLFSNALGFVFSVTKIKFQIGKNHTSFGCFKSNMKLK
jgi:hypothetical protein